MKLKQFFVVLALAALSACAQQPVSNGAVISGTASTEDGKTIPSDAIITIQLYDWTIADAPAYVIAENSVNGVSKNSINFVLDYDPTKIIKGDLYAVSVNVTQNGHLLYWTNTLTSVFGSKGTDVKIKLAIAH